MNGGSAAPAVPGAAEVRMAVGEVGVAVIEDDRGTREGLRLLIELTPGLACAGAWPSVEAALGAAAASAPASGPGVLLLDVRLPGMAGPEAIPRLQQRWPETLILMLTSLEDEAVVVEALSNGAVGYVLKRTPPARLVEAIHEAVGGGSPMSPEIARRVVGILRRGGPAAAEAPGEASLSAQERRLLALLADGHSYRSAADALGVSVNTVRNHIRSLYEKLQVHTRSEAVGKGLRRRLI